MTRVSGAVDDVPTGEQRTKTAFAMAVTMEIRARLAIMRKSARWLAQQVHVSPNYLAKRLRDHSPLTVDDLAAIVEQVGERKSVAEFVAQAWERHHVEAREKSDAMAREKMEGLSEQPSEDGRRLGTGASLDVGKPGVTIRATRQPQTPGPR